MKKVKIFYLIIIILLLESCSEKTKHVRLEKSKDIVLGTPDSTYISLGSLYYADYKNHKYIISYNNESLNLNYFDAGKFDFVSLYKPELLSIIPRNISYYLPYSKDSIFYCDSENNIFYLFNSLGKYISSWDIFKNKPESEQKFIVMSKQYYPLIYNSNTMYSRIYSTESFPEVFSKPLECSFTKNDTGFTITNMPVRYPSVYRSGKNYNNLSFEYVSKCINGDQSIYSFPVDHQIYIYTKDKFIASYLCKSKYINDFEVTPSDKADDLQYTIQTYCTAPYYSKIYFDKYRNLYYRIAVHAISRQKADGTLNFGWRDKPWSIIILNNKFKVLDEIYFKGTEYFTNFLIIPEGLLFQRLLSELDSRRYGKFELNKIVTYEE